MAFVARPPDRKHPAKLRGRRAFSQSSKSDDETPKARTTLAVETALSSQGAVTLHLGREKDAQGVFNLDDGTPISRVPSSHTPC